MNYLPTTSRSLIASFGKCTFPHKYLRLFILINSEGSKPHGRQNRAASAISSSYLRRAKFSWTLGPTRPTLKVDTTQLLWLKPVIFIPPIFSATAAVAVDATAGLSELVEAMHHNIARAPGILDAPSQGPAGGITGLVYESIRSVTGLVSGEIEAILAPLVSMIEEKSSPERQAVLAALNGVMGDYLAATDNPLAISMRE